MSWAPKADSMGNVYSSSQSSKVVEPKSPEFGYCGAWMWVSGDMIRCENVFLETREPTNEAREEKLVTVCAGEYQLHHGLLSVVVIAIGLGIVNIHPAFASHQCLNCRVMLSFPIEALNPTIFRRHPEQTMVSN